LTRVKICGILDVESGISAAEAGADYIGFVFEPTRRQVSPEKAKDIIGQIYNLKNHPAAAGVFVNVKSDEINRIADFCNLDYVQLSGDESWLYCKEIEKPVIKVIHVGKGRETAEIISEIEQGYELIGKDRVTCLLDTYSKVAYGGTGKVFNWRIAREVSEKYPVIIAGGLDPVNVCRLVEEVRPWGVDVSSGVETSGRKDIIKIREFIRAAKSV
jgi:phosphoribosylanthranilate isomerase